jgi:tetratricopeptide (TPR) repeat protein
MIKKMLDHYQINKTFGTSLLGKISQPKIKQSQSYLNQKEAFMRLCLWLFLLLISFLPLSAQTVQCFGQLTVDQLIVLLKGKGTEDRIQEIISVCGIGFSATNDNLARLRLVGASEIILKAVIEKAGQQQWEEFKKSQGLTLNSPEISAVSVAKNSQELAQLRLKGERNYIEFMIPKKNQLTAVGDIRLKLIRTDPKLGKYSMQILVGDSMLEKKDRLLNEMVQFLVSPEHIRYELVINWVQRDSAGGYLSVPKNGLTNSVQQTSNPKPAAIQPTLQNAAKPSMPENVSFAFAKAQDINSIPAYEDFLKIYPESPYTEIVKNYIGNLRTLEKGVINNLGKEALGVSKFCDKYFSGSLDRRKTCLTVGSFDDKGYIENGSTFLVDVERKYVRAEPMILRYRDGNGKIQFALFGRGLDKRCVDTAKFSGLLSTADFSFFQYLMTISEIPLVDQGVPAPLAAGIPADQPTDLSGKLPSIIDQKTAKAGLKGLFENGLQLADQGKYSDAILVYQKALKIDPSQPNIIANMADALAKSGRTDEALAAYKRAISLKPAESTYYTNMGVFLANIGRIPEAQEVFRKAAALSPAAGAQNFFNLGVSFADQGKNAEAVDAFKQAIAADASFAAAYYKLGGCLATNPLTYKDAINALSKYVEIGRNKQQVETAKKMIQTLIKDTSEAAKKVQGITKSPLRQDQSVAGDSTIPNKGALQSLLGKIVSVDDQRGEIVVQVEDRKIKISDILHFLKEVSPGIRVTGNFDYSARLINFREFGVGDTVKITYREGDSEIRSMEKVTNRPRAKEISGQARATQKQSITKPKPHDKTLNVADSVTLYLALGLASLPDRNRTAITGRVELLMILPFHIFERETIDSLVVQGIPLSEDLKYAIRSNLEPAGFITATINYGFWLRYLSDGIVIEVDAEWRDPLLCPPELKSLMGFLKFRNGEIGIIKNKVFVKDGTEAKHGNQVYVYRNGSWNLKPTS